ncbi:hypothetical protein SHIRM173S_09440 [Streptomyces hirsutus]
MRPYRLPEQKKDVPIVAQSTETTDWVSRFADEVIESQERRAPGKPVVVASGLSPSGPIHLGNLREVMTPHLVADEIRRRGRRVRHLISWDDYDRYRKVPAGVEGVDETWAEHIGKPLTSVPAPKGSQYPSWAEHFKATMVESLAELGVEFDGISQTEQYTSGVYREQILHAMKHRGDIDAILDQYRTKKAPAKKQQQKAVDEAELEAAEGSGAAAEDDGGAGSAGYFPYKPYCGNCEKDLTVTSYDDDTTELTYSCTACGFAETVRLSEFNRGKLVWKVDWPMRWAYEGVILSRAASTTRRRARRPGRRADRRHLRRRAAHAHHVRLRRHQRHGRIESWETRTQRCGHGARPSCGELLSALRPVSRLMSPMSPSRWRAAVTGRLWFSRRTIRSCRILT